MLLFAGIVVLIAALDQGADAAIVTVPLLLIGLGVGALASQLGAVTVSSVPDEQSGDVGGLQNTATNLGASIGTALAGAVLISVLTTSFIPVEVEVQSDLAIGRTVCDFRPVTNKPANVHFATDADEPKFVRMLIDILGRTAP